MVVASNVGVRCALKLVVDGRLFVDNGAWIVVTSETVGDGDPSLVVVPFALVDSG